MATNARRPSLGLAACTAIVVGNMVGSGCYLSPAAVAPYGLLAIKFWFVMGIGAICLGVTFARIGAIEVVPFLFSIFTVYGCGPSPVLYGLLLLLFGIPVYVWQPHEHAKAVAAHRLR